jgi:hydroxymethylbilane synthase
MKKNILTIATRESPLALWQANWVKMHLQQLHPTLIVRLLGITTKADQILEKPLSQVGGKGLFVKELEDALFEGRADIAVHSMKDVPMELPPGLCVPVLCEREDPRDAFVSNLYTAITDMPVQSLMGTSSLRRQSQLCALRPDLKVVSLRGNVNTRLAKLDDGAYTGIILAAAGLKRLGMGHRIKSYLSMDESLPAVGQGVLGIECRINDEEVLSLINPLNHFPSAICVKAERAMCTRLGGGCHAPVAAFAEIKDGRILLKGLVGRPDGSLLLRSECTGAFENTELLGQIVAEDLINQGAEEILACLPLKK